MLQYFSEGKGTTLPKYAPEDFLFRWKKLERILEKEGVNGLLLVTGMDGGECQSTSYLFNWLLLGLSGKAIFTNKYLDPVFSEIMLLVSPQENLLFITPEAKIQLDHLIYSLPNCTVFCPTESQYNNKQVLDTLKITFFYQMVSKIKKVGVYLELEQDPKIIEKWSIIQSYALEPVGRTFFTLSHATFNLAPKIAPLFKNLDKHSLKNLVSQTAYAMEGQIKGSTQIIQYTKQNERQSISQLKLQEPLFETVDISLLEAGLQQNKAVVRVLFGERTGNNKNQSSGDATIQSQKAYHMTLEHFDPYTKLQVWRTYFLDSHKNSNSILKTIQIESEESFLVQTKYVLEERANTQTSNQNILLTAYLALVQGVIDAVATVSKDYRNLNRQFIINHLLNKIGPSLLPLYGRQILSKDNIEVQIESYDSLGDPRPIDFKDSVTFKLTSTFYVLKCRLNGLKSNDETKSLGSVVFSQSFLLQEGCFLLLTKNVPYFDFWKCSKEDNIALQKLNPNIPFEELGPPISNECFKNRIFLPLDKPSNFHFHIPSLNVKYYFHERGLRLFHEKIGWHILLYKNITDATMINKIPGEWVLFKTSVPVLFQAYESNILAIQFRGKAFEMLLKKVNNKTDALPMNFLDVIPPLLSENWYFNQQILKRQAKEGSFIFQHQIIQNEFLWSFIESKQLMILNQMKDIKLVSFKNLYQQKLDKKIEEAPSVPNRHTVIALNGTYGSNKLKLAQTLARYGPNTKKYHIFNIPSQNLFSRIELPAFLEMLADHIKDSAISADAKNIIIVVIPSWLNSAEALPALANEYNLASVVAKVSVGNFFASKHGETVENVLTFALPGYSQSVVLDSQGEKQALITSITKILWSFNRQARITRSSNSMLSTGQCADILNDNLFSSEYHKFLRIKYGSLYKFDNLSQLSINYIQFKYPIFDLPLLKNLTKSNGYLIDLKSIIEELKPKLVEAEHSKDELMIGLYKLQESITVWKRKEKATQIRSLKGIIKLQNQKNIVEVLWANQNYKERTISDQRNRNLGFVIFSKHYQEVQVKKFLEGLSYKKYALEGLKALRNAHSLSQEEITVIWKESRDKYLENGEFYDGYFFRDVEGYILPSHPNLNRLIAQWIEAQNSKIEECNNKIKFEWNEYCKKYN